MTRDLPHGVRPAPRRKAAARTVPRSRGAGGADRVPAILARLAERDPDPKAGFDRTDPFRLLVTVLLSAQSTGPTVARIADALFARVTDPAAMLKLGAAQITEIIRPVGLGPSKARNIVKLSAALIETYGGAVPRSAAEM